jgi:hypothetical protein
MSTERETTRIVRSWLEEGVTALPDRVLDTVLDQLPATHQRRPIRSAWRVLRMNSPVRYAIAAAAVLVVALVGYQLLPTSIRAPGSPTASPLATPTLVPSSAATRAPTLPLTDDLAPGTYRPYPDLDLTFEAPAGWATCCEDPASIIFDGGDSLGAAIFFEDFTEVTVYDDPCLGSAGPSSEPRGAEAVAAAIAAQAGSDTPVAQEALVDGLPAYLISRSVPDGLETTPQSDGDATFVDCTGGQYTLYGFPSGERYAQNIGQREDIYIVDTGDRILGFDLSTYPDTAAEDVAALQSMIDSIVLH